MAIDLSSYFVISAFGDKHIGARLHDEDAILVRPDLGLFAVADGAGGDNAGNIASTIALASLARFFESNRATKREMVDAIGLLSGARKLSRAVHAAHQEVLSIARSHDRYRGMGTTIVALFIELEYGLAHIASVGDSICFRMRSGTLEQLSEEHTLLRDLLETTPYFDDAAAARLPRNVITRALGMNEALRVSIRSVDLSHGDRFILVSDGVSDVLNDEAIVEIMQTTRNAEEHARTLISSALEHGADDNCAVVVACVETPLGVTAIPKAHHARPIRTDRKNRDSMAPEPEIVIVEEDFPEDRWDTEVHVIPPLAEDMISDLKAYARAQKTRKTERPPPFRKT